MRTRTRVLFVVVFAIAALIFLSPLAKPPGAAAQTTSLTVSPTSGPVGTSVTASGSGFGANETVNITWGGQIGTLLASPTTDGSGAFSGVTFTIPSDCPTANPCSIFALGQTSGNYATASFTVTASSSTATPTATGTPGPSSSPTATPTPSGSGATATPTPLTSVTWSRLNMCVPISASLYGVGFNGSGTVIAVGQGGAIVRSTDDGTDWQTINPGSTGSLDLYSVAFADSTHAWAGGQSGQLEVSSNGGASWTTVTVTDSSGTTRYPNIHQIFFTSASVGYLAGGEFTQLGGSNYEIGEIFRTTNGGATWNLLSNVPADEQWNSITFNRAGVGLAVATNGDIIRTTDGVNWTKVFSQGYPLLQLNDVAFTTDGGTALAVGDNIALLRSTDAGQTWSTTSAPAGMSDLVYFEGIAYSSSSQGSAVGGTGCTGCDGQTAISTGDAGADWSATYQNASISYLWRVGCDSAVCVAVGDDGTILISRNSSSTSTPGASLRYHVYLPIVIRC